MSVLRLFLCMVIVIASAKQSFAQDESLLDTVTNTVEDVVGLEDEPEFETEFPENEAYSQLSSQEPQLQSAPMAFNPLYQALQTRLNDIEQQIENRDPANVIPPLEFPDKLVKEGYVHPHIALLRQKLDDYFAYDIMNNDPEYFDASLVAALKKFQAEVGLTSDGVIGPATLQMLNRGLEEERKQILINMARLQEPEWAGRPDLRIEVDIARYWLTAFEDNKIVFEMPVVVGTKARQTNRFSTVMTGVRLNPGWTLPPTIKSEDYIPKLRENPEWVTNQGVMIYPGWGENDKPIDPTTIDWNYLSDNEIRAMRFYKLAGDNNPLGRFRFLMNNQYDIYLHDTNQKYLFDKANRSYSSGCVRVKDPLKVAKFLLKDDPKWTDEKIDQVLEKGDTYNVRAKRSIPVYFDYKTAWLDEQGELVLGHDIYNLDNPNEYDNLKLSENDNS